MAFYERYRYSSNKNLIFDMDITKVIEIQIIQKYLSYSRCSQ